MIRQSVRVLLFAALAAALAAACLVLAFGRNVVTLEMDRELPRTVAHGFYPPERLGGVSYAWTSDRAGLRLEGLDRREPWTCRLRFRGARPDPSTLPAVAIDVDGTTVATVVATNDPAEIEIDVPVRGENAGLALAIVSSNTFVPGPADRRRLGIQVDRLQCAAAGGGARPPRRAVRHAAVAGAAFGGAVALAGLPVLVGAGLTVMVAAGQAWLLSTGLASYGTYSSRVQWIGLWVAGMALVFAWGLQLLRSERLSEAASAVILFSAATLHLKVLGLVHPSKLLIDALFHAHRLEWVLAGRYFFTQGMPAGVSFPYAIGLYVFTAPWTLLTSDYVTLLRIVVSSAEVVAGGLLYLLVARTWGDRLAGALAVLLYHCVQLPYGIVGNANMTNVFGQAAALAAVVTLALAPSQGRAYPFWIGAFVICALAFLSHISTFALLLVTLMVLGLLYWWGGDVELRRPGRFIVVTTAAAALFAFTAYYGHFMDVYRTAWRAHTQPVAAASAARPGVPTVPDSATRGTGATTPLVRAMSAFQMTAVEIGWPILVLAAVGCYSIRVRGGRDRVASVVIALAITYVAFLLFSILTRVEAPFERYAAEFVGRVVLATFPAAVMLAAFGAAWAWRQGLVLRVLSVLVLLAAASGGIRAWERWFQ